MPRRPAARSRFIAVALASAWGVSGTPAGRDRAEASPATPRIGVAGMPQPHPGSLLVAYYEVFLRDQDVDAFRRGVAGRYHEATLARLLRAGDVPARRAAVLALGLFGGYESNAAVSGALKDADPTVRALADRAVWAIWYRADTPENNEALARVRELIGDGRLAEAIASVDRLIDRAPDFAEARNQRAIAHFYAGRPAESLADCREVLARNPYHTGALAGMGHCLLRLGRREEAIVAFRRALEIQPYNATIRETVGELEAGNE